MQMRVGMKTMMRVEAFIKKYEYTRKRVLYKLGGYIQRTMQRSMRYKKDYKAAPSKPKSPPKAVRNNPRLRKGIGFNVEERAGKVVIGPDRWDKRRRGNASRPAKSGMTVPRLLNEGGPMVLQVARGSTEADGPLRFLWAKERDTIRAQMEPRPFVEPAREKGEQRFLELLAKNQIRR